MIFRDKAYLAAAILVLALIWRAWRGGALGRLTVSSAKFWGQGLPRKRIPYRVINALILGFSTLCLIVALARPRVPFSNVKRSMEGIDIMLVLDLSASMKIEDFRDKSRVDTAKSVLQMFVDGRQSDRIGFETFSGEAVTIVPPTLDYDLLTNAIGSVDIGDLKDGTAIGDALATAVNRLKSSTAKSRIIVLVTDGDSNVGQVDPLTAGEIAKGYGIKVYSIAIGREGRVAMPFVSRDFLGRPMKTYQYFDSSINPELLKQISALTDGKFYRVEGDERLFRDVFHEIDQLERNKVEKTESVRYEERFARYAGFGLIALALNFLGEAWIFRVYP